MIKLSSLAQLISANVSTMGVNPLALDDVEPPLRVTFTYSAKWLPTKSVLYMCSCTVSILLCINVYCSYNVSVFYEDRQFYL